MMTRKEKASHKKVIAQRDEAREQAKTFKARYDSMLDDARAQAQAEMEKRIREVQAEAAKRIEEARAAADQLCDAYRDKMYEAQDVLEEFRRNHADSINVIEREVRGKAELRQQLDQAQLELQKAWEQNRTQHGRIKTLESELAKLNAEGVPRLRRRLEEKSKTIETLQRQVNQLTSELGKARQVIKEYVPATHLSAVAKKVDLPDVA